MYSTAISLRFEQITKRIESRGYKESSKEFWRDIRADYIRLAKLCRKFNSYVALNVLVSFGKNLYFTLGYLFVMMR